MASGSSRPRVFLDLDIGGHRAAHALAIEFVSSTSIKYGLSSADLSKLGGSERSRIPELFASDFSFSSRGRIELLPAPHERIIIELFSDVAPNACANFLSLCTGDKGKAKGSGVPLLYRGSRMHRLVPGSFVQGGDFVFGNGSGGESIWGGVFKDEPSALKIKLDARGLLAMSNTGKNSNGSQFFFTLAPLPKLNGRHVVFGRVVAGLETLDAVERVDAPGEVPAAEILIADCGLV